MSGSRSASGVLPHPRDLLPRLLVAAAVLLALIYWLQRPLVRALIPAVSPAVWLLDDEFILMSVDINTDTGEDRIRVRANLTRPITIEGKTLYPFGWRGVPQGGIQITLTVGSMLQYCGLMLLFVAAWPTTSGRRGEWPIRLGLCLPLLALLLLLQVPFTVIAELRGALRDQSQTGWRDGWMLWSRFLMDGGGLVIAIAFAAIAIAAGQRYLHGKPLKR